MDSFLSPFSKVCLAVCEIYFITAYLSEYPFHSLTRRLLKSFVAFLDFGEGVLFIESWNRNICPQEPMVYDIEQGFSTWGT